MTRQEQDREALALEVGKAVRRGFARIGRHPTLIPAEVLTEEVVKVLAEVVREAEQRGEALAYSRGFAAGLSAGNPRAGTALARHTGADQ